MQPCEHTLDMDFLACALNDRICKALINYGSPLAGPDGPIKVGPVYNVLPKSQVAPVNNDLLRNAFYPKLVSFVTQFTG